MKSSFRKSSEQIDFDEATLHRDLKPMLEIAF